MKYFISALKKYARFYGRSRRREYWNYMLILTLLSLLVAVTGSEALYIGFAAFMLLPTLTITIRRLHDAGRTGWWLLVVALPILGALLILFFLLQNSREENDYGPSPKYMDLMFY